MSFFETFSRDLSQPEYVHVLINPLPVYGLAIGILALLLALMIRSRRAQIVALVLVVVSAASAWPVFLYGKKGYQRVHAMSDNDGQVWLDAHMHRAEKLIYIYYVTAAVGLIAIVAPFRWPRIAPSIATFTLILAIGLLCIGGYIAYAGGKVRHREFRNESPPKEGNKIGQTRWVITEGYIPPGVTGRRQSLLVTRHSASSMLTTRTRISN